MSNWRPDTALLGRYVISGAANTAVGVAAIYAFMWLGAGPYAANVLGYAAGLLFGYFNARSYVFRFSGHHRRSGPRYLATFAVCYALNLAVLKLAMDVLHWPQWLAQGAGIGTHAGLMFLLSRTFVFADRAPSSSSER